MVAALWSNSNWDDTKGTRKRAIENINNDYDEAMEAIEVAFDDRVVPDEEKMSDDNPFFAAADRGLAKVDARIRKLKKKPEPKPEPEPEEEEELDIDQVT